MKNPDGQPIRIIMVCLGNICRSPMAEGLMRQVAQEYNLAVEVDSAGFERFHQGDAPDRRAIATMQAHGIDITDIRSRVFTGSDFEQFDYILVMDKHNYDDVLHLAKDPRQLRKVEYIMLASGLPDVPKFVPDPYMGTMQDFEAVFVLLEKAIRAFATILANRTLK